MKMLIGGAFGIGVGASLAPLAVNDIISWPLTWLLTFAVSVVGGYLIVRYL